jgi:hypothetical protein
MKKHFLFLTALCLSLIIQAQNSVTNPVDELFDKYSRREGFTVVIISSRMFSMLSNLDTEDKDADNLMARLKSIKILSVEDSVLNKDINFYTELSRKINFSVYEELMVVKEGQNITKFMIRPDGEKFSELLMITGGPGGNSIISIKGDLTLKSISDISKSTGIQELKGLDKIEKKSQEE